MNESSGDHPARRHLERGARLEDLAAAADDCEQCELHEAASQTVFGEGPSTARMMLIGEQPGVEEDVEGHPFVGPAGRLLTRLLSEAGIDRSDVYLTNIVKHFRWKPQGKRRLHQKPLTRHIRACLPWLEAEVSKVGPAVLVTLGATATQGLLGTKVRVTRDHGQEFDWRGHLVVPTLHPSSALRASTTEDRRRLRRGIVEDLRTASDLSAPTG